MLVCPCALSTVDVFQRTKRGIDISIILVEAMIRKGKHYNDDTDHHDDDDDEEQEQEEKESDY